MGGLLLIPVKPLYGIKVLNDNCRFQKHSLPVSTMPSEIGLCFGFVCSLFGGLTLLTVRLNKVNQCAFPSGNWQIGQY